jgi:hypothetical protein
MRRGDLKTTSTCTEILARGVYPTALAIHVQLRHSPLTLTIHKNHQLKVLLKCHIPSTFQNSISACFFSSCLSHLRSPADHPPIRHRQIVADCPVCFPNRACSIVAAQPPSPLLTVNPRCVICSHPRETIVAIFRLSLPLARNISIVCSHPVRPSSTIRSSLAVKYCFRTFCSHIM